MPLVVVQTTIPGAETTPFRITEVLAQVADSADEALDIAAHHIGDCEYVSDYLTARWHAEGGYWLVAYEPVPEAKAGERVLVM